MNNRLCVDSYKQSHAWQYPPNTTRTFSYIECRGSEREYKESVFFGLQYALKEYFSTPITLAEVEEAKEITELHGLPFNYEGWRHILNAHGGNIPLRIKAVAEGSVIPNKNVLVTVENTCDKCYWVTSFFETVLLRSVWYPLTVATQSYYLRKLIYSYLEETADNPDDEIIFKLHDFGSRGVSSRESAGIGGLAHLTSFMGTDTMDALLVGRKYYNEPMAGMSIPAAEHSTISSWGRSGEEDAYRNMLKTFGQKGKMFAVVLDTWNVYRACERLIGENLKQEIIDSGATAVLRPDSGIPVDVLCGRDTKNLIHLDYKYYKPKTGADWGMSAIGEEVPDYLIKGVLGILEEKFGVTINSKGYKVLNHVRVIQGDGVNPESIKEILERMKTLGYSASNIAFGMGGALLQKVNRDTLKMAYKCSAIEINNEWRPVWKDPITDPGKTSKMGRLDLVKDGNEYATVSENNECKSELVTYFENGEVLVDYTFDEIRKRLENHLKIT